MPLGSPEGWTDSPSVVSEVDGIIEDRPLLIVGTKADLPESREMIATARERLPGRNLVAVSSQTGEGLDILRESIWDMALNAFTAKKGLPLAMRTRLFIVPEGTTVEELAAFIHKDLPSEMHKAAVWGKSAKFPGQLVGREHRLQDRDRVEIVKRRARPLC